MNKHKILLVDDNVSLIRNYAEILQYEGFDTVTKSSADAALEFCKKNTVDLIISDILMPDMDGYVFLSRFRQLQNCNAIFIFLSGKSGLSEFRYAMNLGCDDFLVKPILANDLINAVNIRLKRRKEIMSETVETFQRLENAFKLITNHEFLTPLTSIMGFIDILKKDLTHNSTINDPKSTIKIFSYVNRSITRLIQLLERLRLLQEINNEQIEFNNIPNENTSLLGLLKYQIDEIEQYYNRSGEVCFLSNHDMNIRIDSYFIGVIFREIVDNAFKFSPKGSIIKIETKSEDLKFVVKITDAGKMCKADFFKQSKTFFQFNREKLEQQGLGIGLTIARLIAKKIGCEIEFQDNIPTGIVVIIKLAIQ